MRGAKRSSRFATSSNSVHKGTNLRHDPGGTEMLRAVATILATLLLGVVIACESSPSDIERINELQTRVHELEQELKTSREKIASLERTDQWYWTAGINLQDKGDLEQAANTYEQLERCFHTAPWLETRRKEPRPLG